VTDSVNYVKASFTFCDDWTGFTKKAIFKDHTGAYEVALDDNNECIVPSEVLRRCEKDCKRFTVSVYGDKGFIRLTTDDVLIKARLSGYVGETIDNESYLTQLLEIEKVIDNSGVIAYDNTFKD
jgi:hypothetical protein